MGNLMFTIRDLLWLLALLLLPRLLVAAEPDASPDLKENDTPQALAATYRQALANKEWRTCFGCFDQKMQAWFLIQLGGYSTVTRDAKLAEVIKERVGNRSDKDDALAAASTQPETHIARNLRIYEAIQKRVPDVPGFVDELCRRLDALGKTSFPEWGDVGGISIEGDGAVGYVNPSQPVHFCKIDGRWYMTIPDPPPLSVIERARQLEAEVDTFWFYLFCSSGAVPPTKESDKSKTAQPLSKKQYDELRMSVRPFVYQSPGPTVHLIQLTRAQAKKLIEYLTTEGYLQQAIEPGKQELPNRDLSKNCCSLQVSTRNLQLHEDLGWGPGMLKRLDGLRGELDGEAAQAIDAILAGLADER